MPTQTYERKISSPRVACQWKTQAEQQFIIDMPATIADRLRDVVDKHLGIDAAATTGKRGDAPKQERLPARVNYGVTEEHIDEPKVRLALCAVLASAPTVQLSSRPHVLTL